MNRKGKILLAGTMAGLIGAAAIAGTASAHDRRGDGYGERHHGMGDRHHGMMGGFMGGGMGRHGGMRQLFNMADADKDGKVTQDEIDTARAERFAKYDADKDGKLSLEEFDGLFREVAKPMSVRAFQFLDPDGDGTITADELAEPLNGIVERLDRDGDGALSREDRGRRWWHFGRDRDRDRDGGRDKD